MIIWLRKYWMYFEDVKVQGSGNPKSFSFLCEVKWSSKWLLGLCLVPLFPFFHNVCSRSWLARFNISHMVRTYQTTFEHFYHVLEHLLLQIITELVCWRCVLFGNLWILPCVTSEATHGGFLHKLWTICLMESMLRFTC